MPQSIATSSLGQLLVRLREIVETFLRSECREERHRRRVAKIEAIERSYSK